VVEVADCRMSEERRRAGEAACDRLGYLNDVHTTHFTNGFYAWTRHEAVSVCSLFVLLPKLLESSSLLSRLLRSAMLAVPCEQYSTVGLNSYVAFD
jgi:hypothetical protein